MKITKRYTWARIPLALCLAIAAHAAWSQVAGATRGAEIGVPRATLKERAPGTDLKMKVATADKLLSVIALLETKSMYRKGMSEGQFLRILGKGVVVGGPPGDPTHGCPACGYGGDLARATFKAHETGMSPDSVYKSTSGDRLSKMLAGYDRQPGLLKFKEGMATVDGIGAAHRIPRPTNGWFNLFIKIGDLLDAEFGLSRSGKGGGGDGKGAN